METLEQKVAYLKGFTEALEIDDSTNEGKLLLKIVDIISDISEELADTNKIQDDLIDRMDDLEDEVEYIEDDLYDDEDDEECDCEECDCDCVGEIECPDCGEIITLTNDMFDRDTIHCPNCGKVFNLEINCECDDDDDCDCGCCDHE